MQETILSCDICEKKDSDHQGYWYHLSSSGHMDWDQISVDLCSIACLKTWTEKDHLRAHPMQLGNVMNAI